MNRSLFILFLLLPGPGLVFGQASFSSRLADAACTLTGERVTYDPSYFSISYPMGDVPANKGVCTDVIIRAYRKVGIDLQKEVHEDMKANFGEYPKNWGLSGPDRNIDHRRVPNLMTFFTRYGIDKGISTNARAYIPGDIVCWSLGGGITHIGLVSNLRSQDGSRYLIIHNIGAGQVAEDVLFDYRLIGHYSYGNFNSSSAQSRMIPIARGWAKNTINANILRHNSVVTHQDQQFVAYYNSDGRAVLAKRTLGSTTWEIKQTPYKGNVADAHNIISIMVDGDGYLHMSWDHHGHKLRYCRSVEPGSLELSEEMPMTRMNEDCVTYPEFYRLPDGDLIFLYRDGRSGSGNLMMNHYDLEKKEWTQRQNAFINGEGKRNAYWQMCTDMEGRLHLSWVWRETGDVATNHDMAYARSDDGGKTWRRSNGEVYDLPITAANAEYAAHIPQNSELINTTGMGADARGRPYIASYWRTGDSKVPQYRLIYHDGSEWKISQISDRKTPFSLRGGGTKRIPISRPKIITDSRGGKDKAYLLYRDIERGDRVSLAVCDDLSDPQWSFVDLTDFPVGMWEPSYDTELWLRSGILHIYVQYVGQGDGESLESLPPTEISILEWEPENIAQ